MFASCLQMSGDVHLRAKPREGLTTYGSVEAVEDPLQS